MDSFGKAFPFIIHHGHLLSTKLVSTLGFCGEALAISLILAIPLGMWLGHLHRFSFLAINISNFGRALPSLAVLAVLLAVMGIGHTEVVIALVVLAFPVILTNTYVAIDQVDPDAVEAAKGMGLRPFQVVTRVESLLSLPLIFGGIRTAAVFIVATSPLAGTFGGGGLGDIITNEASYKLSGVIGASYIAIALAFATQGLFFLIEYLVTPYGLKAERRRSKRPAAEQPGELVPTAA